MPKTFAERRGIRWIKWIVSSCSTFNLSNWIARIMPSLVAIFVCILEGNEGLQGQIWILDICHKVNIQKYCSIKILHSILAWFQPVVHISFPQNLKGELLISVTINGWVFLLRVCFLFTECIWHFPLTHPSSTIFFPLTSVDLDLERAARLLPFKLKALFRMSALI